MDDQPGPHRAINAADGDGTALPLVGPGSLGPSELLQRTIAPRLLHFPESRLMGIFKCKNVSLFMTALEHSRRACL